MAQLTRSTLNETAKTLRADGWYVIERELDLLVFSPDMDPEHVDGYALVSVNRYPNPWARCDWPFTVEWFCVDGVWEQSLRLYFNFLESARACLKALDASGNSEFVSFDDADDVANRAVIEEILEELID